VKRVGLICHSRRPIRQGNPILDDNDETIAEVSSGGPSPALNAYIAMAYIPTPLSKLGSCLKIKLRNSVVDAQVVKLPFVPSRYYVRKN